MRAVGLIGALVATAVIIGAAAYLFVGGSRTGSQPEARADGKGTTVIGRPMYEAKDEVCKSNLANIRSAVTIRTDPVEETHPASLKELGLGESLLVCPIDKVPYAYDAASGVVSCPHPGHEKY